MFRRQSLHRCLSLLVLASLLSSTLAPIAQAQDAGVTYLPLIASVGRAPAQSEIEHGFTEWVDSSQRRPRLSCHAMKLAHQIESAEMSCCA